MKEFNLSEKIIDEGFYIPIIDVKEFIKLLKAQFWHDTIKYQGKDIKKAIDKLAGEDLK